MVKSTLRQTYHWYEVFVQVHEWENQETRTCTIDINVTSMNVSNHLGAVSIRKTVLPGMAIPMLKIRRPNGRLIFNMEIAIRR